MKITITILFFAIGFFSTAVFAQKKGKSSSEQVQLIAHITYDSVLVNMQEYAKSVKLLEAYQKQLVSEFELKSLELDAAIDNYRAKESKMTDEQKDQEAIKVQGMRKELEQLQNEYQQKIMRKEQELLAPLNEKIQAAISKVAAENGFTHVVEKRNFYFIDDIFDATNMVIKAANAL
jgi:outer membrane protein